MNTPTWEEEVREILGRVEYKTTNTREYGTVLVQPDLTELFAEIHRIEQEAREDERRKALSIIKKLESRTGSKSEGV